MGMPNRYGIKVRPVPMGRDYVFLLGGGDVHVGAAATAYLEHGEVCVAVHAVPAHREGELAAELARKAAIRLGTTVTVVAGMHVDHASKEDIIRMVEDARRLMDEAITNLLGEAK